MSSVDDSRCGVEGRLSGVHGDVADSSAENVGNTIRRYSDGLTQRHLPQAHVICNRTDDELMTQGPAVPLVTVANHMIGSVAPLMQMPHMAAQVVPRDSAPEHGSMVQICVFSTELANYAAESVRIGRYDNIIDFHQDYCTVPVSQVCTVTFT